eukprot:7384516-Prymnesium_polylepis.2
MNPRGVDRPSPCTRLAGSALAPLSATARTSLLCCCSLGVRNVLACPHDMNLARIWSAPPNDDRCQEASRMTGSRKPASPRSREKAAGSDCSWSIGPAPFNWLWALGKRAKRWPAM